LLAPLLRDPRKALFLVRRVVGRALRRVLALGKLAPCERGALQRARFAEELVPSDSGDRHELATEAADVAVRRERRVQIVTHAIVGDLAFRELLLRDRERMFPCGTAVWRALRCGQA